MDDYGRKLIERGAREERALISAELHAIKQASFLPGRIGLACDWLEDRMRQDKKQAPGRIDKLDWLDFSWKSTCDKINELVDAVNAHVEAKE